MAPIAATRTMKRDLDGKAGADDEGRFLDRGGEHDDGSTAGNMRRGFACPYSKIDPMAHAGCLQFKRVDDIKYATLRIFDYPA